MSTRNPVLAHPPASEDPGKGPAEWGGPIYLGIFTCRAFRTLCPAAKMVYVHLSMSASQEDGMCTQTQAEIQDQTGLHQRTIIRALRALEAAHFILTVPHPTTTSGRRNAYIMMWEEHGLEVTHSDYWKGSAGRQYVDRLLAAGAVFQGPRIDTFPPTTWRHSTRIVYLYIQDKTETANGARIARETGLSTATVDKALHTLVTEGHIRRIAVPGVARWDYEACPLGE